MTVSTLPMNSNPNEQSLDDLTPLDQYDFVSDFDEGSMAERQLANDYLVWKAQQN